MSKILYNSAKLRAKTKWALRAFYRHRATSTANNIVTGRDWAGNFQ